MPTYSDELSKVLAERNHTIETIGKKLDRIRRAWEEIRQSGLLMGERTPRQDDAVWEMHKAIDA